MCFIDQDGVYFVYQCIVQFMLYMFFRVECYVVVQVVKVVFVVCIVSDVSCVSFVFCWCWYVWQVDIDSQVKEFKQWMVVFGVMLCQVVVDGNYVYVFIGQCVQVSRQCCGQGFFFIGMYFGDVVFVKNYIVE